MCNAYICVSPFCHPTVSTKSKMEEGFLLLFRLPKEQTRLSLSWSWLLADDNYGTLLFTREDHRKTQNQTSPCYMQPSSLVRMDTYPTLLQAMLTLISYPLERSTWYSLVIACQRFSILPLGWIIKMIIKQLSADSHRSARYNTLRNNCYTLQPPPQQS